MITTADLDSRLVAARERYRAGNARSESLAVEASNVMPGGNTRTVLHFDPFPFRVASAAAGRLTDVDGHVYIDLLGNYTAGLLGHSPEPVRLAVERAMAGGWTLGATHPNEVVFAQRLVDRFPSVDQVRFTNSGTEANLLAIAAAKHHTGSDQVLVFDGGYHGGVLTFGSQRAGNVPHDFVSATFNDVEGLGRVFAASDLACVLVEPMQGSGGCIPASEEFLVTLRNLCTDSGTVLIFDEVMTSRLAPGGAQSVTGVHPDITTLGKYLAGGMSFGAIGGRREIMAVYDHQQPGSLGHAGTFNNNVLTMAAGVATIDEVLTDEVLTGTNTRGDRLRGELQELFTRAELPMSVTGWGSLMTLHPTDGPINDVSDLAAGDERLRELFFFDALAAGFYLARRGFIALSIEVTDDDIDSFVAFCRSWTAKVAG